MVEVVGRYLALQPGETLLDAYCGVGAFALTLGEQAGRVIGVEQSPWSLDDAEANLEAAADGNTSSSLRARWKRRCQS